MIHYSTANELYGIGRLEGWEEFSQMNFHEYSRFCLTEAKGLEKIWWDYVSIPWLWNNFPERRDVLQTLFPNRETVIGVHVGYSQVEIHPKISGKGDLAAYNSYLSRALDTLRNASSRILFVEAHRLPPALKKINLERSVLVPTHASLPDILAGMMDSGPFELYSILSNLVDRVEVVGEYYDTGCVDPIVEELEKNNIKVDVTHVFSMKSK